MQPDDVYVPYYRDQGALLMRGVPMATILKTWAGHASGIAFPKTSHCLPLCIPLATQCAHAVGVALALKIQKKQSIVVCSIGDGATSKGDFYEAINFACVHQLNVLFLINNNGWAISTERHQQSAIGNMAQKFSPIGCRAHAVDGNDAVALCEVLQASFASMRKEPKTHLIDAHCFRLCDHTTVDDRRRYMPQADFDRAEACEPIHRLRRFLTQHGHWDTSLEQQTTQSIEAELTMALEALDAPRPPYQPGQHVYHGPCRHIRRIQQSKVHYD